MRLAMAFLAWIVTGCASPGLPVDEVLGSLGSEDPSLVEAKVVSLDPNTGLMIVDVQKIDGTHYRRNGVRVEADERTLFVNNSSYDQIRHISDIPGTIVEIEGYNDYGVYRALTIALIDVPPDHPVWRPPGRMR
jgi:hypothetical protein